MPQSDKNFTYIVNLSACECLKVMGRLVDVLPPYEGEKWGS
jgi:hypothetical protein